MICISLPYCLHANHSAEGDCYASHAFALTPTPLLINIFDVLDERLFQPIEMIDKYKLYEIAQGCKTEQVIPLDLNFSCRINQLTRASLAVLVCIQRLSPA